jgi:hypothetical protein
MRCWALLVAAFAASACVSSSSGEKGSAGSAGSGGSGFGGTSGSGGAGGSSGSTGGSGASTGGSGGSTGGTGGAGGGGSGGVGGGSGSPDLSGVDFHLTVTGQSKDPGGEGGPAVPWTVSVCIEPGDGGFVEVYNTGTGVAGAFAMGIALIKDYPTAGTVVASCASLVESDPLGPGFMTTWSSQTCCTFDDTVSTFDLNPRKVRVTADVNAEVTESNESNNVKESPEFELSDLPP